MPRRIVTAIAVVVTTAVFASPAFGQDPVQQPGPVVPPSVTTPTKDPKAQGQGAKGGVPPFMTTNPTTVALLRPAGGESTALPYVPAEAHCYTTKGQPYQRVGRYRWALRTDPVTWRLVAVYDPLSRRFVSEAEANRVVCAAWQLPRTLTAGPAGTAKGVAFPSPGSATGGPA